MNINPVEFTVYSFLDLDYRNVKCGSPLFYKKKKGTPTLKDKSIEEKLYLELLKDALFQINSSIIDNNNELIIGSSEITKKKNKDNPITAANIEKNKVKINGVIGAVSCLINQKHEYQYNGDTYCLQKDTRVLVKFKSHVDKNESADKSFFAANLLTYGKIESIGNDSVNCDDNNLFDFLLIDVLARKLDVARYKGIYRTYRAFESNDEKLRGAIDINKHIKFNAGLNNGRIASKYRENTINNYFNILLLKTYQYIKKKYPELVDKKIDQNPELRSLLSQLQSEVDAFNVPLVQAIFNNTKPISHPYYFEYEEVRKICLKILRLEGVSIFETSNDKVNGFLYYLPDLWEDCCLDVFKRIIKDQDLNNYSIVDQKSKQFLSKPSGTLGYCESRPDFLLVEHPSEYKLILDAKMRPEWESALSDYFDIYFQKNLGEDINKCIRDMIVFNTMATGVIFPVDRNSLQKLKNIDFPKQTDSLEKEIISKRYYDDDYISSLKDAYKDAYKEESIVYRRTISDLPKFKNTFYVIPFIIPNSSSYDSYSAWKKEFDISRNSLCDAIYNCIFSNYIK